MAITDKKTFQVRGKDIEVWAVKSGIRNYTFYAQIGDHIAETHVFIDQLGDVQGHINRAREYAAEQAVRDTEHLEAEALVD
jgi:hypothetical protein